MEEHEKEKPEEPTGTLKTTIMIIDHIAMAASLAIDNARDSGIYPKPFDFQIRKEETAKYELFLKPRKPSKKSLIPILYAQAFQKDASHPTNPGEWWLLFSIQTERSSFGGNNAVCMEWAMNGELSKLSQKIQKIISNAIKKFTDQKV